MSFASICLHQTRQTGRITRLAAVILALATAQPVWADDTPDTPAERTNFRSDRDGRFDASGFLDQAYGFIPIAAPITEPAVGYGAAFAVAFLDRNQENASDGLGRPNISVVGGMRTENGTRGGFAGNMHYWLGEHLQTLVGAIKSSVNLDYYGTGNSGFANHRPIAYQLDITGLLLQGKYRIGDSRNWLGAGYMLANTEASPRHGNEREPIFLTPATRIGGITLTATHDSRDNIFTPTKGNYLELSTTLYDEGLGSDLNFRRSNLIGMHYLKAADHLFLGIREMLVANRGKTPFYMAPFVSMRGVPAMRYQGETVAQLEAEVRWQFWQRLSLIGFAGVGTAADKTRELTQNKSISAYGMGVRYELADKYGLHMGLDVANSRDGPAVYFQVGSAWARP